MKKYRIHTTISTKHHELLKKYAEKFGTQQKTLECALEKLNDDPKQSSPLSTEEEIWLRAERELKDILIILHKSHAKMLYENVDFKRIQEYINNNKPVEFALEYYYQKPLKKCSLLEVIKGMILNIKIQGSADTINYTEHGDYYTVSMTHNMGLNFAKMLAMEQKSLFESYGVKIESNISKRSIFFKIFKN